MQIFGGLVLGYYNKLIVMRTILTLVLLIAAVELNAQNHTDSILYLKKGVVNSGYILKWKELSNLADPAPFIIVYSNSSVVLSIGQGYVSNIKDTEFGYIVVIKSNDTAFAYSNLHSTNCKIGDSVHDGMVIGTMLKSEREPEFELVFSMMLMKNHYSLGYHELFRFLRDMYVECPRFRRHNK